ncbi:MAG: hypothetical protein AB1750_20725, partial [Chloroflexota bacterium]
RVALSFYPLAVHASSRTVRVGRPIRYNPFTKPALERQRLKNVLERSIHAMLIDAALENDVRLPIPG